MATRDDKTIGIKKDVWKALKELALERENTLSEAIEYLLDSERTHAKDEGAGSSSREKRD